jgi:acetylornithine deacetylase/succinyl-diaminopimelate desuccinylase-like protein
MMMEEENLIRNLQSLVKIPSFRDSIEVSRWIKDELEGFGYSVDSDGDGNLVAEAGKGKGFLLNGHMDTVAPGDGWKHDPFGAEIEDGKLYGRGASDMKAGLATMLETARLLKLDEKKLRKRVVFAFTAFEEGHPIEKNGVMKILPKLRDIDKGLILEPTTDGNDVSIAMGCRGSYHFNVDILGERGHSSLPGKFENPIYRFPALLDGIRGLPPGKVKIPILGETVSDNLTVTQVCAKEGINVIPGKCSVSLDRRALPSEKPGEIDGKLERICRKSLGSRFRLERTSSIQGYQYADSGLMEICKAAISSAGMRPRPYFEVARFDGCVLKNHGGIGTFMLGPGSIEQAHTVDECCEIEGLVKTSGAILDIIRRWDSS